MKLSVLVPCYNEELYIKRCIDSLLNQTIKIDEILILNDGSTDNTLSIIKKYESENDNIKVLSVENKGLSAGRNTLINNCNGDYFYFVDADDWVENKCIENFKNKIFENEYECIFSPCYKNNKTFKANSQIKKNTTKEKYCINNLTYVWNIFIKKSFWFDNKLFFNEDHKMFEDIGAYVKIMAKLNNAGFILEKSYHWTTDKNPKNRFVFEKDKLDQAIGQMETSFIYAHREFNGNNPRYINDILAFLLSININYVLFLSKGISKKEYIKKIKQIEEKNGIIKFPKSPWKFIFFILYKFSF
ncbi:MAG: glycosyltransferase family 2 protein [Mycoplasmoidaceae bacterium]